MPNIQMMCLRCGRRKAQRGCELCKICQYKDMVEYMLQQPEEAQDLEFAVCEECGSSLDSEGICRNQNCGASPDVGKDWI